MSTEELFFMNTFQDRGRSLSAIEPLDMVEI